MTPITVKLGPRSYPIYTESSYDALPSHLRQRGLDSHLWVVSHRTLLRRFGRELLEPLRRGRYTVETIAIPESERAKSSEVAEYVLQQLARRAARRIPVLAAFGGGVVGDLTGFVAAIFRRGVPYVQLPTTLLAQVDSAIGGKVAVDLPFAKNLIGAFYQPCLVFNHLGILSHLPARQRRSGLSEIIKYGVMGDAGLFRFLEEHLDGCLAGEASADRFMVQRCVALKGRIVSRDERETKGLRIRLNFGHTVGHALEAVTGYGRFTHGEAIAIGMACASAMSVRLRLWGPRDHERLISLLERAGLPTHTSGVPLRAVERTLLYDKKFVKGRLHWVLPTRIGRVIVRSDINAAFARSTIREYVGA